MGKTAAVLGALGAGGGGAAGIYGAHKMGWFEGTAEKMNRKYNSTYIAPEKANFKKQNDAYCFGETAGVFDKWKSDGRIDSSTIAEITNADDAKLDTNGDANGCLVVNWEIKKPGSEWNGNNFRLLWTASKGNKGFSVYLTGTTVDNNSIEFDGIAHVFKKEGDSWKATHVKDMKTKKKLSSSEIKDKFPQKKDNLGGSSLSGISGKYWGFLDENATKLKEGDGHKYGFSRFTETSGSTEKLGDWSTNLDTWWKHFFENGNSWNMTEVVKEIQGNWG